MLIQMFANSLEAAIEAADVVRDLVAEIRESDSETPIRIGVFVEYADLVRVRCAGQYAEVIDIGPVRTTMIGNLTRATAAAAYTLQEDIVHVVSDKSYTSQALKARFWETSQKLR